MKYPYVVPKRLCRTPVRLTLDREGVNDYGEPLGKVVVEAQCNYQDEAKTIFTSEKKQVRITGTALFNGDICPELPTISGGSAVIFGVKRHIARGRKARNPDGTVNYTEVQLE